MGRCRRVDEDRPAVCIQDVIGLAPVHLEDAAVRAAPVDTVRRFEIDEIAVPAVLQIPPAGFTPGAVDRTVFQDRGQRDPTRLPGTLHRQQRRRTLRLVDLDANAVGIVRSPEMRLARSLVAPHRHIFAHLVVPAEDKGTDVKPVGERQAPAGKLVRLAGEEMGMEGCVHIDSIVWDFEFRG